MIARGTDLHSEGNRTQQVDVNLNLNLQGVEQFTEVMMALLTRLTAVTPADEVHRTSTLFPDLESAQPQAPEQPAEPPPAETAPAEPPKADRPASGSLLAEYRTRIKSRRVESASKKTVRDHETSASQFDDWWQASKYHRFGTPVVSALQNEPEALLEFARWKFQNDKLSPVTVGRRLTHVVMICKAAGVIIEKPKPDELKRMHRAAVTPSTTAPRRIPSWQEVDCLAKNVDTTTFPYGDHAPYFWRGWIRYLALFGPRSRDVVSTQVTKPGVCKSDVIFETLCPVADVNAALQRELHSPHGWLHYEIKKDHRSDCPRILLPMPRWLRDWIRFFYELSDHPQRVFPSDQSKSASLSQKSISRQWNRILKHADVDNRLRPSEGKGNIIAIRKFAANWWELTAQNKLGDRRLAEQISFYVLHHSEVTTKAKHYLSTQAAVLPAMIDLLADFPLPAADAPPVSFLPE